MAVTIVTSKVFGHRSSLLKDLISYWKLDDSSTPAVDSVGLTNLTISGATPGQTGVNAKLGTAYLFDGTNDIVGGVNTTYDFTTAMTISFWMKTTSTGTYKAVISNYDSDNYGYEIDINDGNQIEFLTGNGATYSIANSTTNVTSGSWFHVVCTYDNVNNRVYVNGALEGTNALAGPYVYTGGTNETFKFGRRGGGSIYYSGYLDEVGVWNRALNLAEVTYLYKAGTGRTYPFTS
jgi:hypothetical protein